MIELTTTRANPLIDPSLHVWGWEIPVYLFLGGMVAGMMAISGWFLYEGRHERSRCSCFVLPGLSLVLITAGMLALFLDLEHKPYVWRLYTTFEIGSPMSWGAWILLLVYPALIGNFLLRVPRFFTVRVGGLEALSRRLRGRARLVRLLGIANLGLGVGLGIYTGVLLGALGARPLWSSALLGPLFLVSGLSAAAAFVHLIASDTSERVRMARADNVFLTAELLVVALFVIGLATTSAAHKDAAALLLGGPYTALFWGLTVGLGIVVPLFIQTLAVSHRIRHTPIAPIMVMLGGMLLRVVIVYAGQASHWSPI